MGFQTTGTASEYFAVDAGKVTPLPETMTYSEGAMIEPLAVTVHAVRRAGDVRGQKIAVLARGPSASCWPRAQRRWARRRCLSPTSARRGWNWQKHAAWILQ